ncbi:hypothetical protein MY04_4483 [Flammeovirga sp. MY04]|uniref:hypothetical protein n=1 Tax=Flammeovirga sp. MY04 TaxID=1191459 RepID=UPI0008062EA6|nr:hypothetical protein [Flammeovirga sp. MY04]ANQ51819.1 hypothetical protein MY04_4483 [Flammeovirga sp. MY04]
MKSVIFFVIYIILFSCVSSNNNCNRFKEGRFIYFNKEEKQFDPKHIAFRTSDKQIGIDLEKGDTLTYDLKWMSDCEYKLIFTESTLNKEGFIKIGDTLTVTIEPIDHSTFSYSSIISKENYMREFKGVMKKIN